MSRSTFLVFLLHHFFIFFADIEENKRTQVSSVTYDLGEFFHERTHSRLSSNRICFDFSFRLVAANTIAS